MSKIDLDQTDAEFVHAVTNPSESAAYLERLMKERRDISKYMNWQLFACVVLFIALLISDYTSKLAPAYLIGLLFVQVLLLSSNASSFSKADTRIKFLKAMTAIRDASSK